MKKFLIATAALAITAGAAAAEVAVSGDGRMGVVYNGDDLNFSSRVRAKFAMSGTSDSGLEFGGSIRADNAGAGAKGAAGSIWVSGAFGKIEMGDVVGAAESVHGNLPEVGFTDLGMNAFGVTLSNDILFLTGDSNDFMYGAFGDGPVTATDNPSLLYTYSMDNLDFALGFTDGKMGYSSMDDNQEYSIGLGYSFGDYRVALGYEVADSKTPGLSNGKLLSVSASGTFGNTVGAIYYADAGGSLDFKAYGVGVSSTFDATTVNGYVQRLDGPGADVTWYGLGAEYDLGGGASVAGGIMDNDLAGTNAIADLGLKFKF